MNVAKTKFPSVCHGCTDRCVGCHDTCKKYVGAKKEHAANVEAFKTANRHAFMLSSYHAVAIKRMTHRKGGSK